MNVRLIWSVLFFAVCWLGFDGSANADVILDVSDALVADGGSAGGSTAIATVDGTGLGIGFPTFPDTHSAFNVAGYISQENTADASLHYDFGVGSPSAFNIVRIWNYHGGTTGDVGNNRGARDIIIFGSNDSNAYGNESSAAWVEITQQTLAQASPDGDTVAYGEQFDFASVDYRYVRFRILNSYGSVNVGLAEVQFISSVPEPGGAAIVVLFGIGMALNRRRK